VIHRDGGEPFSGGFFRGKATALHSLLDQMAIFRDVRADCLCCPPGRAILVYAPAAIRTPGGTPGSSLLFSAKGAVCESVRDWHLTL
jgi:hypothetical protein